MVVEMTSKRALSKNSLKLLRPFLSNFDFGWEMELVITMHDNSNRSWSTNELSDYFQLDKAMVGRSLAKLEENGLIACTGDRYIYSPKTSEKNALVELMIRAFAERKLDVIRKIYSSDMHGGQD